MKTLSAIAAIIVGVMLVLQNAYFIFDGALILPCGFFLLVGILLIFVGYNTLKGNITWEE